MLPQFFDFFIIVIASLFISYSAISRLDLTLILTLVNLHLCFQ